jgi:hypothetical protein
MTLAEAYRIVNEENNLKDGKTGLVVYDIDDTLLKADPSVMGVIIKKFTETGKWETVDREDTTQFATSKYKDEKGHPKQGYKFDFSEFRDPEKIKQSFFKTERDGKLISKGAQPLIAQLRMMDSNLRAGYDVAFLTARGAEKAVFDNLMKWLKYRNLKGEIVDIRKNKVKLEYSRAVNDEKYAKEYAGMTDGEKKAAFLKDKCSKYSIVKFVDDDKKNLAAMRALHLPNLKVIEAQGIEHNQRINSKNFNS